MNVTVCHKTVTSKSKQRNHTRRGYLICLCNLQLCCVHVVSCRLCSVASVCFARCLSASQPGEARHRALATSQLTTLSSDQAGKPSQASIITLDTETKVASVPRPSFYNSGYYPAVFIIRICIIGVVYYTGCLFLVIYFGGFL